MSAIDSAIIRSLTEHIKSASDGGTGGGVLDEGMLEAVFHFDPDYDGPDAGWHVSDDGLNITFGLPGIYGRRIQHGDILRFRQLNGRIVQAVYTETIVYEGGGAGMGDDGDVGGEGSTDHVFVAVIDGVEKKYFLHDFYDEIYSFSVSEPIEVPDNASTGFFYIKRQDSNTVLGYILNMISVLGK